MAEIPLPSAFEPKERDATFLAAQRKRALGKFKLTRSSSLWKAVELAYWLHVFDRDDEAMDVCEFLAQVQFAGNYSVWSPIETSLALESRLLLQRGQNALAAKCVARIKAAGYEKTRLDGTLLHQEELDRAIARGDRTGERTWRFCDIMELCYGKELGGSKAYPPDKIEKCVQEHLAALRNQVVAPAAKETKKKAKKAGGPSKKPKGQ